MRARALISLLISGAITVPCVLTSTAVSRGDCTVGMVLLAGVGAVFLAAAIFPIICAVSGKLGEYVDGGPYDGGYGL